MTVFEKIEAQQKGKENTAVFMVGEQLKDICRRDSHCASIVDEDLESEAMSLAKAAAALQKYANENHGKARCFCITPNMAEQILRKFYGLPEAALAPVETPLPTTDVLDLSSLL